jgi:hypothetical protein
MFNAETQKRRGKSFKVLKIAQFLLLLSASQRLCVNKQPELALPLFWL